MQGNDLNINRSLDHRQSSWKTNYGRNLYTSDSNTFCVYIASRTNEPTNATSTHTDVPGAAKAGNDAGHKTSAVGAVNGY